MKVAVTFEEFGEEVAKAAVMAEDEAIVGSEASVKTRFLKLLEQHPELTRPQAYMQAVMEMSEPVIAAAVERMKAENNACQTDLD